NLTLSLSDHQPPQTVVSAVSGVASNTSVCAKKQKVSEVPTEEKPNTSETVTQMLQDEMFKLLFTVLVLCVYIQQISFMSLMQVAQSTFASLQNVQQILQQHQPVHLEGIKPVHSAEGNASLKLQLPT
ncbi:CPLN1 protein, partial [Piaya cayana]|nr:CPLN1 protein [Piaya cayana]